MIRANIKQGDSNVFKALFEDETWQISKAN